MDTVHMGFTNLFFDPVGPKKKKKRPPKIRASHLMSSALNQSVGSHQRIPATWTLF